MTERKSIYCGALFLVALMQFSSITALSADITMNGTVSISGNVTATSFTGDASGLTNIPGSSIANTSITSSQIANYAVTPRKLAYNGRIAIVAKSGGDYSDPAVAMADFDSWCPDAINGSCLLKIMPGVYTVTSPIQMHDNISIEGSGRTATIIVGSIISSTSGVVNGSGFAELRSLTIRNIGGGANSIAIYAGNLVYPGFRIKDVDVQAMGGAMSAGVYYDSAQYVNMNGVLSTAEGTVSTYGVYARNTDFVLSDVETHAQNGSENNYGIYVDGGGYKQVKNSELHGTTAIHHTTGSYLYVANTLVGGTVANSGILKCVGTYNFSFEPLSASCN